MSGCVATDAGGEEKLAMRIAIYAAVAQNGAIGRDGGLPWKLASDLRRFRSETMGKPLVMGRRTWEGLPRRPLPGRLNIVVTRQEGYRAEGGETAPNLEEAVKLAARRCGDVADEICIIGGGQIYREAMPLADRLRITRVLDSPAADTFFPPIDPGQWDVVSEQDLPAGEKDTHATRYVVYERRTNVH
jgi:dihydrofolate reductase